VRCLVRREEPSFVKLPREPQLHLSTQNFISRLALKLLDTGVHLARNQRQRHNTGNVHLRAENLHVEVELLADRLDVLETFLVVRTCATDPDGDFVLVEQRSVLAKRADDTLERRSDLRRKS
jgi:hypothetical protein